MNWQNLNKNKCPKCGKDFGFQAFSEPNYVHCPHCDFRISHKRYTEIVNSQITKRIERNLNGKDNS